MSREPPPPPRLLDSDGAAGDCVRRALVEDEITVPSFVRLREKRLFRLRVQRAAGALALAAAAFALLPQLRDEAAQPSISAEKAPQLPPQPRLHPEAPVELESLAAPSAAVPPPRKPTAVSPRSEPEVTRPVPAPSSAPAATAAAPPSAGRSAKACAELARSGGATEALSCYQELASGTGMGAELALFEQARLEGKVLRQPARALSTLEDYRRRFPEGSLRAEVMLAQIEWLIAAGDQSRARLLVDEALASGLLRERAPELERLRSTLATDHAR